MRRLFTIIRAVSFLLLCISPSRVLSLDYEFLLFPEFNISIEDYDNPRIDVNPGIDFFASVHHQDFSLIAEYFFNKKEFELERLLVGWDASDYFSLWLGRHHNYLGYWNTEFHHGAFLETSITRPSITQFEDDGGILPTHATGLAGEIRQPFGDASLNFAMLIGVGPVHRDGSKLAAFDILNPKTENHNGTLSLKVTYLPNSIATNQIGISLGGGTIPSTVSGINKIEQVFVGPFLNWRIEKVRLISELVYVYNRIYRHSDSFRANILGGYLQAEISIDQNWTLYGRYEGTAGQKRNLSIIFPDYVTERQIAGLRLDLGDKNALKFEIGRRHEFRGTTAEASFQWSAVFP